MWQRAARCGEMITVENGEIWCGEIDSTLVRMGRATRRVADYVGHDVAASSDEAANLCAPGMARQRWHQDSAAALAYIVALSDGADGTQFVQIEQSWKDVMALKETAREAFLGSAWAAATTAYPRVVSGGKMQAGDVLFFYTQRIPG